MPKRGAFRFNHGESPYFVPVAYADWWQRAARMALKYRWEHSSTCNHWDVRGSFDDNNMRNGKCSCGLYDLRKAIGEQHE